MPIPPGFDNTIVVVTGSPVASGAINAELASRNAAGYWLTSLEFFDNETALLLFVKTDASAYGFTGEQKVNPVTADQSSIDSDKAAETAGGYWPTGMFVTPGGTLWILYQLLDPPAP
jgi:hypothetical protein